MPTAVRTRSSVPTSRPRRRGPACTAAPEVFWDPLIEDSPRGLDRADRERRTQLLTQARTRCEACPLLTACLYDAVVRHDVAGFAGGTTARQRHEIRRRLGVVVAAEDLDTLAGVVGGTRLIDRDEVLRLRRAHPDETLEQLAQRLGCSLSTIKRKLRRERQEPATRRTVPRPSPAQVLQVTSALVDDAPVVRC